MANYIHDVVVVYASSIRYIDFQHNSRPKQIRVLKPLKSTSEILAKYLRPPKNSLLSCLNGSLACVQSKKTFYVPPLSHSKSSQKSNKAINRTNSYKNVLVVVVLCIIYPNTPLTMSIFFSVLAGKKIQNVHFGILRHRHILLFTRRERIPHLMDLLSKRFASHIY